MCMCVYGSGAAAHTNGWILMKFFTNDLTNIYEARFPWILKL